MRRDTKIHMRKCSSATRIVAEWMGLPFKNGLEYNGYDAPWPYTDDDWFDPTAIADDEQLVREWARENLTEDEIMDVQDKMIVSIADRKRIPSNHVNIWMDTNTGDLTKAVAKVLIERKDTQ